MAAPPEGRVFDEEAPVVAAALVSVGALCAPALASPDTKPAAAVQAPKPDADPALWVVRDADTTIYLFGTFHMLDGKRDWFNDEIRTAFEKSSELVLEADIPGDPAQQQAAAMPIVMRYAVDQNGRTLSSRLDKAEKERLDKVLSAAGAPAAAFENFEPWFVGMTLSALAAQKMGLQPEHGAEEVLKQAAKPRNMPVGELEGMEMQMRLLDGIPEPLQLAFLRESLAYMDKVGTLITPMQTAWYDGNMGELVRLMNESLAKTPGLYEILLSKRNAAWAEWIDQRMDKPGTVFIAVGAGHLGGRDSVQDYLRQRGLSSERVKQTTPAS
jgi:uncharacterized protein YbaP (TraB family)